MRLQQARLSRGIPMIPLMTSEEFLNEYDFFIFAMSSADLLQIAKSSMTDADISDIVGRTTQNISSRLRNIQSDAGVQAAFK